MKTSNLLPSKEKIVKRNSFSCPWSIDYLMQMETNLNLVFRSSWNFLMKLLPCWRTHKRKGEENFFLLPVNIWQLQTNSSIVRMTVSNWDNDNRSRNPSWNYYKNKFLSFSFQILQSFISEAKYENPSTSLLKHD